MAGTGSLCSFLKMEMLKGTCLYSTHVIFVTCENSSYISMDKKTN